MVQTSFNIIKFWHKTDHTEYIIWYDVQGVIMLRLDLHDCIVCTVHETVVQKLSDKLKCMNSIK